MSWRPCSTRYIQVLRKAPCSDAEQKPCRRSNNASLPQTSPPQRSSNHTCCHPQSWILVDWRPQYRDTGAKQVCHLQELRGPAMVQRMAALLADRTEVAPPFKNFNFDFFGPWTIRSGRHAEAQAILNAMD